MVKAKVKVRLKWTHSKEDTSWPQDAEKVQTFPSAGFVSAKEFLSRIELELLRVIAWYHRRGWLGVEKQFPSFLWAQLHWFAVWQWRAKKKEGMFATHASHVDDITNTDLWAQNGSAHGPDFAAFKRSVFTNVTRIWAISAVCLFLKNLFPSIRPMTPLCFRLPSLIINCFCWGFCFENLILVQRIHTD